MAAVNRALRGCSFTRNSISFYVRAKFHTGEVRLKSNSAKLANMMGKIMNVRGKKKKGVNFTVSGPTDGLKMVIDDPSHKRALPRRVTVLNKLFMNHISDILANGSMSTDFAGRGLEITRVSVSREFNYMSVLWATGIKEHDEYLEKTLPGAAFTLRHELTQLHLMGTVPRIVFVRDLDFSRLANIQRLLDTADKGAEEEEENVTEEGEDEIPEMPMNVYGLRYDEMVSKLKQAVARAKAPHRNTASDSEVVQLNPSEPDDLSIADDRDAIRKFLLQKKIERRKYLKEMRKNDEQFEGFA